MSAPTVVITSPPWWADYLRAAAEGILGAIAVASSIFLVECFT